MFTLNKVMLTLFGKTKGRRRGHGGTRRNKNKKRNKNKSKRYVMRGG